MRRTLAGIFASLVVAAGMAMLSTTLLPQTTSAINFFGDGVCQAHSNATACSGNGDHITGTGGIILRAASLLSIVSGIAAVIAIIIAGITFVTADGDSGKISSAKNTIIYAVVGLIVIFLARAIVVFVVNNV